jgi:hypothetical protein
MHIQRPEYVIMRLVFQFQANALRGSVQRFRNRHIIAGLFLTAQQNWKGHEQC